MLIIEADFELRRAWAVVTLVLRRSALPGVAAVTAALTEAQTRDMVFRFFKPDP